MPGVGLSGAPDYMAASVGLSSHEQKARETLAAPETDNYHTYAMMHGEVYEQTSKG